MQFSATESKSILEIILEGWRGFVGDFMKCLIINLFVDWKILMLAINSQRYNSKTPSSFGSAPTPLRSWLPSALNPVLNTVARNDDRGGEAWPRVHELKEEAEVPERGSGAGGEGGGACFLRRGTRKIRQPR